MPAITGRERRLIGLGIAAALVIGAYLYVLEPLLVQQRTLDDLLSTREALLARRQRLVTQRARAAAELDASTQRLGEEAARFLPGPTPPLAASALQRFVKAFALEANIDVRSERVLPPTAFGGLQEVPIELTVAGTIRQVVALLQRIEQAQPLLAVKDLKVRVMGVGQPRELMATVVVAGYFLPGPVSPSDGEESKGRHTHP